MYCNINNKSIYLGIFEKIEDAISARLQAELKYFGQIYTKPSVTSHVPAEATCITDIL